MTFIYLLICFSDQPAALAPSFYFFAEETKVTHLSPTQSSPSAPSHPPPLPQTRPPRPALYRSFAHKQDNRPPQKPPRHHDTIIHRHGLHRRSHRPKAKEEDYQPGSDGEDIDCDSEDTGEVEGPQVRLLLLEPLKTGG